MTKQPKVRKPHPVLHGIGLVLSVILLVAVLVGTMAQPGSVHDGHHR